MKRRSEFTRLDFTSHEGRRALGRILERRPIVAHVPGPVTEEAAELIGDMGRMLARLSNESHTRILSNGTPVPSAHSLDHPMDGHRHRLGEDGNTPPSFFALKPGEKGKSGRLG